MIDNQFIKKPSGFSKQRLDSFVRSVKTNKQDVQKKELDEALELHTQLVAQDMMQRAMQLPPFEDLKQSYMDQAMQEIPQAAYGMEIGAVMPSINTPFTYPSQQNITPPNSDMFKKNADKYAGKGTSALKNLFNTAANAVLNPAIQEYNQQVYAKQQSAQDAEETDVPSEQKGGDLIKAQTLGEIGNSLKAAYDQAMSNLNSDEPVYNEAGDLIDRDQLKQAATDAYNKYYESVAQAYKDNPTPNWQATDFSYLNQYPTMPGLEMPGYNLSGQGIAPELYKGTAAAQMTTNMQADYPGLGRYFGLSPQKNLELGDVNYSPNYKAMYNDALSKGQYDRFETNIEANPTLAGKALDKIGIGKLFSTRNYDVTQNILPQGQSVLDPERLAETQRRQTLLKNADLPGGGLFQTDEMDPYIWENRSRRDRRDVLEGAGIDPSRKNLRRLGEDYFENLKQDRVIEEAEASREGYENKLAAEEAAVKSGAARGSIGNRPRNPYDLIGTGVQSVPPAPAVTGPTNAVTPNLPSNPANKPRIYGMGRGDAASRKQYENNIIAPEDALASRFQRFEREEGSAMGTGLDNYGWNNLPAGEQAPTNIKEATDMFQRNYGAKAKALGITNNDASTYVADYMFNSGRKPEDFLLYASGKASLADVNGTASLDAQWQANKDQILKDINSGKISMETLAQKRDDILKTTRAKVKPTNPNDPSTAVPNDAYINSWQKRAALPVQNLPIADRYAPTKQEGGTMLPMFQVDGEYPGYGVLKDIYDPNFGTGVYALPSADSNNVYPSINWNTTDPFNQKQGPFNYDQSWKTQGLHNPNLFPDANKMQTFFDNGDAPLTGEAFGQQLDQYVPKYTGQEPQQLATATGKAKLTGNIAPTTYLTIGNTAGKYLADNVFSRDEKKRAEQQYRASRFLENNLSLTSADTQFDPRLRGFDRTTDAFGGAPYAGAQVQYGQPLIAMGQRGTEIPITMQEGGVYTLTPEMIKQIIDNGGEIEYMDNSNNFVNPFNQ